MVQTAVQHNNRGRRPYSASSGVGAQPNTIQNTKPQTIKETPIFGKFPSDNISFSN